MATDGNQDSKVSLPVNQSWLEQIINKKNKTSGKLVGTKCGIIGEGKGFLSVNTKAELTWNTAGDDSSLFPKAVIIKKPTIAKIAQIELMKDLITKEELMKVHNQEVKAYTFLTKYDPAPFPMAKCFYAEKITKDGTGLLITEMVEGRSLNFNEDYNLEKVKTLAKHIANLQAYGLNHPDSAEYFGDQQVNIWDPMIQKAIAAVPTLREYFPNKRTITDEEAQHLSSNITSFLPAFESPGKHGLTPVVSLADVQPNNILWKVNQDNTLSDEVAAMIDFQISYMGTVSLDLSTVLSMGFPPKLSKNHEDEIFDLYYKTLKKNTIGELPVKLDEVRDLFKKHRATFAFVGISFAAELPKVQGTFGLTDERLQEMMENTVEALEQVREDGYL